MSDISDTVVTSDSCNSVKFWYFRVRTRNFYKMVYKPLYFGWSIPENLHYEVKFSIYFFKKSQKQALKELIRMSSMLYLKAPLYTMSESKTTSGKCYFHFVDFRHLKVLILCNSILHNIYAVNSSDNLIITLLKL